MFLCLKFMSAASYSSSNADNPRPNQPTRRLKLVNRWTKLKFDVWTLILPLSSLCKQNHCFSQTNGNMLVVVHVLPRHSSPKLPYPIFFPTRKFCPTMLSTFEVDLVTSLLVLALEAGAAGDAFFCAAILP